MDTGNTVKAKSVITRQLHNKIQAGFAQVGGNQINTAKTGSGLERIGRSKEITMTIDGFKSRKFKIKPTVVEDLCDDLNLGNGFLAGTGDCDIIYRGNTTKLRIGQDEVELVRTVNQAENDEGTVLTGKIADTLSQGMASGAESSSSKDSQCNAEQQTLNHVPREQKAHIGKSRKYEQGPERIKHVYCAQNVKVKKNTMTFIPAYLDKAVDANKEILVEPLTNGPETVAAVYKLKNDGRIAVLNPGTWDITIPKGSRLGEYSEIEPIPSKGRVRELKEEGPKIGEIIKKLKIEENEILKKNPVVKDKLIQVIEDYADVFSDPEGVEIGTTDLIEFDVRLKEGARPIRQKLRPLNPKQRDSLRKQLDL